MEDIVCVVVLVVCGVDGGVRVKQQYETFCFFSLKKSGDSFRGPRNSSPLFFFLVAVTVTQRGCCIGGDCVAEAAGLPVCPSAPGPGAPATPTLDCGCCCCCGGGGDNGPGGVLVASAAALSGDSSSGGELRAAATAAVALLLLLLLLPMMLPLPMPLRLPLKTVSGPKLLLLVSERYVEGGGGRAEAEEGGPPAPALCRASSKLSSILPSMASCSLAVALTCSPRCFPVARARSSSAAEDCGSFFCCC